MPDFNTQTDMMELSTYNLFLGVMAITALFVFIALHFVKAGYGYLYNPKFGFPVPNKLGWVLMEAPVFIAMWVLWYLGGMTTELAPMVLFSIIQIHYFQRSFIFPLLLRGNSKMPVTIMLMGATFNTLNAVMQGGWLFYIVPTYFPNYYADWFCKPYIYIGVAVWLFGFITNLNSDYIIRHLRKPGDKKHYIPRGGMFRYVSSANYFGEFMEVTDDVVRVEVGDETEQPNCYTDVDIWLAEPILVVVRVVSWNDIEQPTTLHQSVQGVEGCAHQHNRYRHL